ncbi:MAG TPA: isoprenylcysteine carboxylmethyltransferase family protein, partial [Chitinophagaceae bacterium]|nr:isoprenylcysteine carboxylmethyltransferase family protein [Chitinophagaceae bacterium]
MNNSKAHPGIYIPPPLFYAAFFFLSVGIQKLWPVNNQWQHSRLAMVVAYICIALFARCAFPALLKFARTRNSIMTIRPARSLQTDGIYAWTRNPMYLGLLFLYSGLALLLGNGWTLLLIPFLMLFVQLYIIRREETYLTSAFGD